jgi:hypothetical protein
MKQTKVASAVAAVITNANLTQRERGEKWLGIFTNLNAEGVKLYHKVQKWVKSSGMTIFTLADAQSFKSLYAAQYVKENEGADSKKADKAAANKLAWLRRELRAADVKVESDPRGGANNKTGSNGKAPAETKETGKGLSAWNAAMALILQSVPELTTELDRLALTKLLAKLETQHKAQVTK